MDRLLPGVDAAVASSSRDGGRPAAEAIMTTDTVPKTGRRSAAAGSPSAAWPRARACSRRALATMLVVAHHRRRRATPTALDAALRAATRATFDRVDSDGCMSTNDTVLLLASGASGVTPDARRARRRGHATVCADLARQLIADAEGASKDDRHRGRSARRARTTRSRWAAPIARNNLLKCAIHGEDPNWGRVLAAVGTTARRLRARRSSTSRSTACGSAGTARSARTATWSTCAGREVTITVDLHAGDAAGDDLDQRPDRRLRPRELGVLHMNATAPAHG